jgi:hypothetical protein
MESSAPRTEVETRVITGEPLVELLCDSEDETENLPIRNEAPLHFVSLRSRARLREPSSWFKPQKPISENPSFRQTPALSEQARRRRWPEFRHCSLYI